MKYMKKMECIHLVGMYVCKGQCQYPVHIKYSETSIGCACPFGAFGEYGQKADINVSEECFKCALYKVRETPIKEMDRVTYKKYEQYMQGQVHKELFE